MQLRLKHLMIAATALLFASCKKTNEEGKLIPNSAGIVLQIDVRSLSSKISWEEIKSNPLFKAAYSDAGVPAALKKILNDPSSAGIDLTKGLLFFSQKDSIGAYVAFEGNIRDEATFRSFNTEVTEN